MSMTDPTGLQGQSNYAASDACTFNMQQGPGCPPGTCGVTSPCTMFDQDLWSAFDYMAIPVMIPNGRYDWIPWPDDSVQQGPYGLLPDGSGEYGSTFAAMFYWGPVEDQVGTAFELMFSAPLYQYTMSVPWDAHPGIGPPPPPTGYVRRRVWGSKPSALLDARSFLHRWILRAAHSAL